jgi:hypothetical protein
MHSNSHRTATTIQYHSKEWNKHHPVKSTGCWRGHAMIFAGKHAHGKRGYGTQKAILNLDAD